MSCDIIMLEYNIMNLNLIMLNIQIIHFACTEQTYAVIVLINHVHVYACVQYLIH